MPMSLRPVAVIFATLTAALAVAACGSSSESPGGAGGEGSSGGAGTGGGSGAGGSRNTGGSGVPTGGASGTGGSGTGGGGSDATAYLDDCFAGLRKLAQMSQTSDHNSSDGAYRVRLAIEYPPGTVGTSGTIPWAAVRVGIVTPQKRVCIKDQAALANAYMGSLHNCSDTLRVSSDGLVFELKPPDVSPERPVAKLTVTGAAAVMLPTVTCKNTDGDGCASGGPCK